MLISADVI